MSLALLESELRASWRFLPLSLSVLYLESQSSTWCRLARCRLLDVQHNLFFLPDTGPDYIFYQPAQWSLAKWLNADQWNVNSGALCLSGPRLYHSVCAFTRHSFSFPWLTFSLADVNNALGLGGGSDVKGTQSLNMDGHVQQSSVCNFYVKRTFVCALNHCITGSLLIVALLLTLTK